MIFETSLEHGAIQISDTINCCVYKTVKIPEAEVASSDSLFYPTNCLKPKYVKISIIYDKEKQLILTYEMQ